jgi:hypothetical protein
VFSGLVVSFQFVVSAGLILATLVVNQQMQFFCQLKNAIKTLTTFLVTVAAGS